MPHYAIWLIAAALVTLSIAGTVLLTRFLARLKSSFPSEWAALGSPNLINPEGSRQENALFIFIMSGRFLELNDHALTRDGVALQTCGALCIACIFLLFVISQRT